MIIRDVTHENIATVQAFLERNADTALFLLSNLATLGPRLGGDLNSGNFKCLESDDELCAVFCLTRRGNLLAETGGRAEFARTILDACCAEPIQIRGVVGEWRLAEAIWKILLESPDFTEEHASKEILHRLDLRRDREPPQKADGVRCLAPDDFWQWEPLNTAYLSEEGLPVQGTIEQRRAQFEKQALAQLWWGYLHDGQLVAIAALNAIHKETGQVGGVYTIPNKRRRGFSRATMEALLADSAHLHHLQKLILFTGEKNLAARRLYESLGFTRIGDFALLFGSSKKEAKQTLDIAG